MEIYTLLVPEILIHYSSYNTTKLYVCASEELFQVASLNGGNFVCSLSLYKHIILIAFFDQLLYNMRYTYNVYIIFRRNEIKTWVEKLFLYTYVHINLFSPRSFSSSPTKSFKDTRGMDISKLGQLMWFSNLEIQRRKCHICSYT